MTPNEPYKDLLHQISRTHLQFIEHFVENEPSLTPEQLQLLSEASAIQQAVEKVLYPLQTIFPDVVKFPT